MPRSRKPAPGAGDLAGYRNLIRSGGLTTTAPRERPVIFSGESVRALLAGTKTQTRRLVKGASGAFWDHAGYTPSVDGNGVVRWAWSRMASAPVGAPTPRCPFGAPGGRLWVREAWAIGGGRTTQYAVYRASIVGDGARLKWRSPIHMPRWASRFTLEIVAVRVERLNEISDEDCFAEGLQHAVNEGPTAGDGSVRGEYRALWESIHGPGSWDANPWVWVIEFRRVEPVAGGSQP